jgi:hypothetical protein
MVARTATCGEHSDMAGPGQVQVLQCFGYLSPQKSTPDLGPRCLMVMTSDFYSRVRLQLART